MKIQLKVLAFSSVLFILSIPSVLAQNDADLFLYSKEYYTGSARFNAMSGAFGSVGADISSAQINPAAMGRFSASQASVSLGTTINSTTSNFESNSTKATKANVSIPSFGIVFTKDLSNKNNGDMYSQFGIGMNRMANYSQKTTISGEQFPSILDNFVGQANGYYPDELRDFFPFSTYLAYQSYAIDYDTINNSYTSHLNSGNMNMSRTVTTRGGVNEFFLSYSRNRLNKLYYGGLIGIRTYNHDETYVHSEDLVLEDPNFNGFDYTYHLKTTGLGVNLKLGVIYLITDNFRVGSYFHTPTYIAMQDKWDATMTSRFKTGSIAVPTNLVPEGQYKYRMLTPLKFGVSASYIIGMNAVISGDIEYVGYNQGRLMSTTDITYPSYNFKTENNDAKKRMTNAVNFRFGTEVNIQQKLFIRAGFAFYGNAYRKIENVDPKPDLSYSAGLGYKKDRFSIDLSYVYRNTQRSYLPFAGSATARLSSSSNAITLTGSIRF